MRLRHNIQYMIVPWLALVGCANEPGESDAVRSREEPERVKSFILADGVNLSVVFIEGGSFLMGSTSTIHVGLDLVPHDVEVPDFWMGRFEVTQAQYVAIMGESKRSKKNSQVPVSSLRWKDALEFCKRVSERTGWDFNLPTEAQWEYACRAGSKTEYCFGDDEKKLGDYAWYDGNMSRWSEVGYPHDVGKKRSNDWGLYDMHGNVWEFCLDRFEDDYFKERDGNPEDKEYFEKEGLIPRVIKGGCWWNAASGCRSAGRGLTYERDAPIKVGFRVVAMPPDDEAPPAGAETSSDP